MILKTYLSSPSHLFTFSPFQSVSELQSLAAGVNHYRLLTVNVAAEQLFTQVVEHVTLDGPLHWTRSELGVEAHVGKEVYCSILFTPFTCKRTTSAI